MYIQPLREAGKYAIETFTELSVVERFGNYSRFETAACAVVYGDRGAPSHSVRLFKAREE